MPKYSPKSVRVTVGTAAVAVQAAVAGSLKLGLIIQADASNAGNIFIGGSDVTTSNGIQLAAGATLSLNDFGTAHSICEWDLTKVFLVSNQAAQAVRVSYAESV